MQHYRLARYSDNAPMIRAIRSSGAKTGQDKSSATYSGHIICYRHCGESGLTRAAAPGMTLAQSRDVRLNPRGPTLAMLHGGRHVPLAAEPRVFLLR
jgi:hypothetical protein